MSKSKKQRGGFVYSTNPDFNLQSDEEINEQYLEPHKQDLRVLLDKKQRKGKVVTLITGFIGNEDDLKDLAKILKSNCGTGGSVKDGEIIIQGNFKNKVGDILEKAGYKYKFSGGN